MNTKSSAVTSLPSDHFNPSFSVQVMDRRSAETPPFPTVGISTANAGTSSPSGPYQASGSSVIAPASRSLNPAER